MEKWNSLRLRRRCQKAVGELLVQQFLRYIPLRKLYLKLLSLFYYCVTPVIDYYSGVWDFDNFSCVDNVQNRALRYFLGSHRFFLPILLQVVSSAGSHPQNGVG